MKGIYIKIITVILIVIVFAACKHESQLPTPEIPTNGNNGGGSTVDTGICFERDILPIFISNCAKAGCHDAISRQDGYQFTDYNSITSKDFIAGNASATELYEKITEDRTDKIMPPPPNNPLTNEQKELIRRWINEGAENSTNCGTKCDSNNYKFSTAILPMMNKYCVGCHSGATAPRGIVLDNYNGVTTEVNNGRLLGAVRHEAGYLQMPQGGNKLSDCEIRQIEKWIVAGALND